VDIVEVRGYAAIEGKCSSIATEINHRFCVSVSVTFLLKIKTPFSQIRSIDRSSSGCRLHIAVLQSACSPSLIPQLSAGLSELASPLAEDSFLQSDEITMLNVHRVCESPREFSADDAGLVDVGTDD